MLILTAVLIGLIWVTAKDIHDFIYKYDGIAFYREHPWMLAICLAIAVATGLSIHVIQTARKAIRSRSPSPTPLTHTHHPAANATNGTTNHERNPDT